MRSIAITPDVVRAAISEPKGAFIEYAVEVNWPELRLTEQQIMENAVARAFGGEPPHEDHSIFSVRVPYIKP